MPNKIDLTGKKFERLTVMREVGRNTSRKVLWECLCDCGNIKVTHTGNLRNREAKSCGCYNVEYNRVIHTTHGHSGTRNGEKRIGRSPEHRTWRDMINRCTNPNGQDYDLYMGRGIKVCDRWLHSFETFYKDMGTRPSPKHSIDRINVSGDYEPSNCRWATPSEQTINQRLRVDNKSGHKGVFWDSRKGKWQVSIGVNRKQINIGDFDTKEQAIDARKQAELQYHNKSS